MVGECHEKMVLISSSTTNEIWPQIDEKNNLMNMASNNNSTSRDMEKPIQDPPQQQLKCPRCDSSNTKFCYYNNYSLSQPRHFCKACKRYWTRGGTLRNVPVGGGCRKNKRIKRPSANNSSSTTHDNIITTSAPNISNVANPSHHHHHHQLHGNIDLSSTNHLNPLFYGLTNERSDLNIPFSRLFNTRISSHPAAVDEGQVYSLADSNIPGLMDRRIGLGFTNSSPGGGGGLNMGENNYGGFNPIKQIQDVVMTNNCTTTTTLLNSSSYPNMFGSSSSTSSNSTSTMASLIASTLHHQHKFLSNNNGNNNFHNLAPNYNEELQMSRDNSNNNVHEGGGNGITMLKEEKMDPGHDHYGQNNRLNWNYLSNGHHQTHEQIINSSDPSLSWNGAWLDPSNMGSNSVPSLI